MEYECHHCKEYYKRGIYSNVNSFLDQLEKKSNILTSDKQDKTLIEEENEMAEKVEANKGQKVYTEFINALNHINT